MVRWRQLWSFNILEPSIQNYLAKIFLFLEIIWIFLIGNYEKILQNDRSFCWVSHIGLSSCFHRKKWLPNFINIYQFHEILRNICFYSFSHAQNWEMKTLRTNNEFVSFFWLRNIAGIQNHQNTNEPDKRRGGD